MNRHHPYGGYDSHPRRGNTGPGPDRTGRGRGRGSGRGGGKGIPPPPPLDGSAYTQNGHYNYPNDPSYNPHFANDSYGMHEHSYGTIEGMS